MEQPRWRGDGRFAQQDLCDIDQRLMAGAFIVKRFEPRFDPDVFRLAEFAALLGTPLPASRPYQTFAGFLLQDVGTIPNVGDKIEVGGWRFEIVDLDGRRIDKLLATKMDEA